MMEVRPLNVLALAWFCSAERISLLSFPMIPVLSSNGEEEGFPAFAVCGESSRSTILILSRLYWEDLESPLPLEQKEGSRKMVPAEPAVLPCH